LTKSSPNFTKICTGLPGTIPKLFPKDSLKRIKEIAGISDLVKWGIFGQEREKLENHLLVAIQQD